LARLRQGDGPGNGAPPAVIKCTPDARAVPERGALIKLSRFRKGEFLATET